MMDDRHRPGSRYEPTVAREDTSGAAPSDDSDSDGEFEFPFVSRDAAAGCDAAPADELFAGGRIRAFYPVFGRVLNEGAAATPEPDPPRAPLGRLFQLEQARTSSVASTSSTSSSAIEIDDASPDSYCLWAPGSASPARSPRKSGSTGSMARWRRIGELVVGRSHSDGRDKFLFLSAPASPARDHPSSSPKSKKQQSRGSKAATDVDTVAAGRRLSYGGGNKGRRCRRAADVPAVPAGPRRPLCQRAGPPPEPPPPVLSQQRRVAPAPRRGGPVPDMRFSSFNSRFDIS